MPLVTYIDTGIPTDVTETKGLPVEIVGTSGVVDTELPAAAALADDTANPTVPAVGAFGQVWNSADSNWDRQRGGTGSAAGLAAVALVTSGTLADAHTATPGSIMDTAGSGRQLAVAVSMFNGTNYDRLRGSATDGLTVNLGTNNDVTVTSGTVDLGATDNAVLDAIEVDTTTLAGAVAGTEMQVDVVAALPAGTNAIGKLAANSGVDIGDVDITSIAAGDNNIGNVDVASITNGSLNGPGAPTIDSYQQYPINLAAAADQVLVSSAPSKQIWVYGYHLMVNVAGTVSFQDEDNVAVTGIMPFGDNGGATVSPSGNFAMPIWKLGTDKDLEVDVVTSEFDGWIAAAIVSV